jgi:hypothetical protein
MDPRQADAWLSASRFEPFLTASEGDHPRAVALYDWHAEVAAACFGMIHHFEVLLRNAIDGVLGEDQPQQPLKETWLMDFDVLQPDGIKQVIVAVERLEKGKGITRSRVVAGVSFGFWAGLFSKRYEELWRHRLRYAFPDGSPWPTDSSSFLRSSGIRGGHLRWRGQLIAVVLDVGAATRGAKQNAVAQLSRQPIGWRILGFFRPWS